MMSRNRPNTELDSQVGVFIGEPRGHLLCSIGLCRYRQSIQLWNSLSLSLERTMTLIEAVLCGYRQIATFEQAGVSEGE